MRKTILTHRVIIYKDSSYDLMLIRDWCNLNFLDRHAYYIIMSYGEYEITHKLSKSAWYFENKDDATIFQLTWS
jgi:hypothetical protein